MQPGTLLVTLAAVLLDGCASAAGRQTTAATTASTSAIAPALDAIRATDLRRDMFAMAGDAMRGREAGTLDEMRATGWVAEQARAAGLQPAGDDGTFFQWWPMRRTRLSEASRTSIGGRDLTLWRDAVVLGAPAQPLDLPLVFVGDASAADLASMDLGGKAAVAVLHAPAFDRTAPFRIASNFQRAAAAAARERAAALSQSHASAVVLVSDDAAWLDSAFDATAIVTARGSYGIDSAGAPAGSFARARAGGAAANRVRTAPTFWVRHGLLEAARAPSARLVAQIVSDTFYYPSGNVIGVVRGTDPSKANEYVLYSGHQDHDGVRFTVDGDSIWNGADDNASVSVAMLAIARAFVQHPAARPILFVWHGAEERGLLGSRWFVNHPTVPRSSIIAVLNGDMIGRNNPDGAALLGVSPEHRNSNALVAAALRANGELTHFKLDTLWDHESHPEGWYYRSDHLPYARAGIPAVMYSTLLHADYHTPRDNPDRIDIAKLQRMAEWMYGTGWIVANAAERPDVVAGFKLPR